MKIAAARRKRSTSNVPSASWNFLRFRLDRLHAVSSRNMYSLHGLLALIGPLLGQVCQRLIVESYCTPGSPQYHVPSAICRSRSPALYSGPAWFLSVTQCVFHGRSPSAACMNSSLTRTERFAFCNMIEL